MDMEWHVPEKSNAIERDRLLEGLAAHLPDTASWSRPGGGFFTWLQLPPGIGADALAPVALAHGVAFLPAHRFFIDSHAAPGAIRLAFSMYPPDTLQEATSRLGEAIRELRARG